MAFIAVSSSPVCCDWEKESFPQSSDCLKGLGSYKRQEKGSIISLKSKRDLVQGLRCKDIKELAWDYEGAAWQQVWIYPELKDLSSWIRPAGREWVPLLRDRGVGMCNSFSWPGVHLSCVWQSWTGLRQNGFNHKISPSSEYLYWVDGEIILVLWLNLICNGIYENMAWFSCDLQQL